MARRCFFSFHYQPDNSRAAQVRNMDMVDGNHSVSDNDWESITGSGALRISSDTTLVSSSRDTAASSLEGGWLTWRLTGRQLQVHAI